MVPPDPDPTTPAQPDIPTIGSALETLPRFSEFTERWLAQPDVPDLARVAFGAVLNHIEPDQRTGYMRLPNFVPVSVDPESSDFMYQINLPVPSRTGIEGLQINRLTKWGISFLRVFSLNAAILTQSGPQLASEPIFALRLELDINTKPEISGIPRDRVTDVFRELVQMGLQIADTGIINR